MYFLINEKKILKFEANIFRRGRLRDQAKIWSQAKIWGQVKFEANSEARSGQWGPSQARL